jgi:hypothetical protein
VRLYASSIVVLIAGMCAAAAIWLTAEDDPLAGAYQAVVVDGKAYPVAPVQSKVYMREVQRFGGKAAVLFDEIDRWFAGLWRGKSLAITVGWISIFAAAALLLAGYLSRAPGTGDAER